MSVATNTYVVVWFYNGYELLSSVVKLNRKFEVQ